MPTFVKKPIEVEAHQFTGDNFGELKEWTGSREVEEGVYTDLIHPLGTYLLDYQHPDKWGELWVEANQSWLPLEIGEWIIKDKLGFYPCKDSVFQETYGDVEIHTDIPELHLGDKIHVYGREFILMDMVDTFGGASVVDFKMPVELIREDSSYTQPDIPELTAEAEDARMLGRCRMALMLSGRPMGEVDAISDRLAHVISGYRILLESNGTFDAETVNKVYQALQKTGLSDDAAKYAIVEMQNAGILFRERG
jgi:hypothetical protein